VHLLVLITRNLRICLLQPGTTETWWDKSLRTKIINIDISFLMYGLQRFLIKKNISTTLTAIFSFSFLNGLRISVGVFKVGGGIPGAFLSPVTSIVS